MTSAFHRIKHILTAFAMGVALVTSGSAETLDEMFDKLAASSPDEARLIEQRIVGEWSKSGSAAIDLLLSRGSDALDAADYVAAAEHFTAAIDHAPDFAEAYHGRATAYYMQDRIGPAIDDLRQTLVLNPRHFGALAGFAIVLEDLGREEQALEVYRRIMKIHPHLPEVAASVQRLELQVGGHPI